MTGLLDRNFSQMEFFTLFNNKKACTELIKEARWPKGKIMCPFCYAEKIYILTGYGYKCANCRKRFTETVDTIFQNNKNILPEWMYLMYSMALNKKNVSSHQVGRNIGLTQKTSWGIMHKTRRIFADTEIVKLSGVVEIDECFIGGGKYWKKWGSISGRKAPVLGLVERKGMVIIKCIDDRREETVESVIRNYVEPGSTIYTDGFMSYRNLHKQYDHHWLDHGAGDYVHKEKHTNTIEGVWRILKSGVRNGSHHISAKHAQRYCDEVAYRYNTRHMKSYQRFNNMLIRACNTKPELVEIGTEGIVIDQIIENVA